MNLPNKITVFRLLLVPILLILWLFPYAEVNFFFPTIEVGHISLSILNLIVLGIFVIASFSDFLDGNIARKKNLVTTFGKFADPIADKILVNTMLIIMLYKGMVPVVPVILMLVRDTLVDGFRMVASNHGVVVAAGILGKAKTVLQMFAIIFILLNNLPFELFNIPFALILLWTASFVSVFSGIQYFNKIKSYIFESM